MTRQRDQPNTATLRAGEHAHLRTHLRTRVSRAVRGKSHVAASNLTARHVAVSRAAPHVAQPKIVAAIEPAPNREHEGYLIKELQHLLRAQIEARIRAKGLWLSFPHSAVLMMLSEQPGLSGAQLARRCSVTAQTMNGLLMPLEKKGLIERVANPENARELQCYMKSKGTALMQQCMNETNAVFKLMLGAFSNRERDEFRSILHRCISALQAHAQSQSTEGVRHANSEKERLARDANRRTSRGVNRIGARGK